MRMPKLLKGSHPAIIAENIRTLRGAGHPEGHATALALQHSMSNPLDDSNLEADGANGEDRADGDGPSMKATSKTIEPKKVGQKPLHFKEGGLHASAGVKPGQKIPAAKHAEAKSGKLGPKAQKQEMFYENVLKK